MMGNLPWNYEFGVTNYEWLIAKDGLFRCPAARRRRQTMRVALPLGAQKSVGASQQPRSVKTIYLIRYGKIIL